MNVANDCCTLLPSDISIFHILSEHHTHTPAPLSFALFPQHDTSDDVDANSDVGSSNCSQLKIVAILSLISLIVASAESVGGAKEASIYCAYPAKAVGTCVCMGYAGVCVRALDCTQ